MAATLTNRKSNMRHIWLLPNEPQQKIHALRAVYECETCLSKETFVCLEQQRVPGPQQSLGGKGKESTCNTKQHNMTHIKADVSYRRSVGYST